MANKETEVPTQPNFHQGQGDEVDIEDFQKPIKFHPDPELDNFLAKVDEISEVIKALRSANPTENERAFLKADLLLRDDKDLKDIDVENAECKVTKDRSVINKAEDPPEGASGDTEAFMRMVEADAKERAENRKERKAKSDVFRKKGNIAFSKKDFAGALLNYNEAIKLIKDSPCLYNNRALTFIRLGIFSSAVEDCQRALDLEEYSLRARMFMAKSYFMMGDAEKCREVLKLARNKLPGSVELIDDYGKELFNMGVGAEQRFDYDLDTELKWKAAARYEYEPWVPESEESSTE